MATSLQVVFNRVMEGEEVVVLLASESAFNSARVALLRKFRKMKELYDELGADNPYADKFLKCSLDKQEMKGRFQLASLEARKNVPRAEKYIVQDL